MAKSAKELGEIYKTLVSKAQLFNEEKADAESGLLSAEDQATFDAMLSEAQAIRDQQNRAESLDRMSADLSNPQAPSLAPQPGTTPGGPEADASTITLRQGFAADGSPKYVQAKAGRRGSADYVGAFNRYLARLPQSAEDMAVLRSDDADQMGFMVASEQFAAELLKEVDDLVFVRQYAKVHQVRTADTLGIRKRTKRSKRFAWSSELEVHSGGQLPAYGKRVLTPHHLTGEVPVSRDLVRRSTMSTDAVVRDELGRDSSEMMEDGFLGGDGNQKPLGVFTPSEEGISTGRDVPTGANTGVTPDALVSAKFALKSQYRRGQRGTVRWLFHRDALKQVALLKDGDGHYLFRPGRGINDADPDMLLGYPVDESERTPNTFTAGNYFGLLANWRYYEIADSLDMEIQVLTELEARSNQVLYIARLKTDGMPTLEEAFVRLQCGT